MIKTTHSLADLDAMAADYYKLILKRIEIGKLIADRNRDIVTPVFTYLQTHLKDIIKGRPDALESHIPKLTKLSGIVKAKYLAINPTTKKAAVNKWFKEQIFEIIDYGKYIGLSDGKVAYDHSRLLGMPTCPYCNAQFTFTIKTKNTKTRPEFDHFIFKGDHPYFALSFFNLIPACHVCNANAKGSKLFLSTTHSHPFLEGAEGIFQFRTGINAVDFLMNKIDFNIQFVPCPGADKDAVERAERSYKQFKLQDRYNYHKDYAGEIIARCHIYNNSLVKEIYTDYKIKGKPLFKTEDEIKEFYIGNHLREDSLHLRILSKMGRDIADEFDLRIK